MVTRQTALLTGITGFAGSHLADYLLTQGVRVVGLKRWRSPMDNIQHLEGKVQLLDGELDDSPSLTAILDKVQPDIVYHLAAQSFVAFSYQAPIATLQANAIGTANLLEAVRHKRDTQRTLQVSSRWPEGSFNPIIILATSSEVYGQVTEADLPIREDCPLRPVSPYGASKVAQDTLGYMYHKAYGLRVIRVRPFSHTGPRQHPALVTASLARQIALMEKGEREAQLYVGNLESVRTFMDVRDLAEAYWLCAQKCQPGEVLNIGGDDTMTVGDMLHLLVHMSPLKDEIRVQRAPHLMRPADVTLQVPDSRRFREATGWKPTTAFSQTLRDTLEYWRQRV